MILTSYFFFFKQKTAYEMRISDWSSDVCSSDLYGLHERLAQLREHHEERLQAAWEACDTPKHAIDMLPVLFRRKLDLHQQSFAIGEAVAHLHCLFHEGRLERVTDKDGIHRFIRAD